jgi:lysophospholipase L1-like esterase
VDRRGLARWDRRNHGAFQIVCVGDSITRGTPGEAGHPVAVVGWVEQLGRALAHGIGPESGGFRGLWRPDEWTHAGSWAQPTRSDPFDVAPFRRAWFSSGASADTMTWRKPAAMTVRAFDLHWFHMPGAGDWQYRVDDGPWRSSGAPATPADNKLHTLRTSDAISARLEIRGFDGDGGCIAPIAGISTYAAVSAGERVVVHNLGCPGTRLAMFCRPSAGDPLAVLDELAPDLVTVLFSNDVVLDDPDRFRAELVRLVERVRDYADVLLIAPCEQCPQRAVADADPASIPQRSAVDQAAYRSVTESVAQAMDCAYLDLYAAWSDLAGAGWDAAYAHGLMADELHPSPRGHDDIAVRVEAVLGRK